MRRDYKREYQTQKARGEHKDRMERQKARREMDKKARDNGGCLLYTSPSPRDGLLSRMPSSA